MSRTRSLTARLCCAVLAAVIGADFVYAVLGIGNPEPRYAVTRHNVGWMVLDRLAARCGTGFSRAARLLAATAVAHLDALEERLLLVKPATYVNRSGQCARAVIDYYGLEPSALLVVVDDLNLPLGAIRIRASGSPGGHNGLRDLVAHIGRDFPRVRLGIGPCPPNTAWERFVLAPFAAGERAEAEAMVKDAAQAVLGVLAEGVAEAQHRYSRPGAEPDSDSESESPAGPDRHADGN